MQKARIRVGSVQRQEFAPVAGGQRSRLFFPQRTGGRDSAVGVEAARYVIFDAASRAFRSVAGLRDFARGVGEALKGLLPFEGKRFVLRFSFGERRSAGRQIRRRERRAAERRGACGSAGKALRQLREKFGRAPLLGAHEKSPVLGGAVRRRGYCQKARSCRGDFRAHARLRVGGLFGMPERGGSRAARGGRRIRIAPRISRPAPRALSRRGIEEACG